MIPRSDVSKVYAENARFAYEHTDGRHYRERGSGLEILCCRTGRWRSLRTASDPERRAIREGLKNYSCNPLAQIIKQSRIVSVVNR